MRECPHCKAQIGEDARFCLYCMTPLTEKELILPQKKKNLWWVFAAVGAVLLGLVAALMLLRDRNPVPSQPSSGSSAVLTTESTTESITESATDATTDSATESATGSTTESTEETTTESTTESTTEPATEATTEPPATNPPATEPPATEPPAGVAALPRYDWQDPNTLCTYRYRPAVQEDVLGLDYQVTENDVVLEMVDDITEDCIVVPSYVDGKRVVALSAPSYSACGAYQVYLPETLLAVHDGALSEGIDALFIAGEVLALESNSTVGEYTDIHTSKTCRNQYGVLYANLPRWEEFPEQVYSYRTAGRGDGYDDNYTNINGDIYIIGINRLSSNGVYHIPAYIDGKKVIGILTGSFKSRNAKIVYLPETVQQICEAANIGQAKYLDIYFSGDTIDVINVRYGTPNEVTLHCSATCIDGEGRYIKDCAAGYGVNWEEWNG